MSSESNKPQRVPKRLQREGRVESQADPTPAKQARSSQAVAAVAAASGQLGTRREGQGAGATAKRAATTRPAAKRVKPTAVSVAPVLKTNKEEEDRTVWERLRLWMKATPALSFSLLLHAVAFVGLGAVTFVTWQPKAELTITATAIEASEAPIEELTEIDMGDLEEFEEETFEEDVAEMSEMVLEDVAVDAPIAEAMPEVTGTAAPVGSAAAESSDKSASMPKKKKGAQAASFYGAPAQGNKFAFIVDNSNSMVNGKMLTTMDQLLRSINGLTAKQEFYVIFYSDTAYPIFYPNSETGWVQADKANKARLFEWLKTVELCSGGRLDLALQQAFTLEPDAIFLVGDGSDVGQAEQDVITAQTKNRRFVVHSLCVGGDGKAAEKLAGLSEYTGGTFRFVQPLPEFVNMSKTNKFKMNKSRGKVWGKQIDR